MNRFRTLFACIALLVIISATPAAQPEHKTRQMDLDEGEIAIISPPPVLPRAWDAGTTFAWPAISPRTKSEGKFECALLPDRAGLRLLPIKGEKDPLPEFWVGLTVNGKRYEQLPEKGSQPFASQNNRIVAPDVIETNLISPEGVLCKLRLICIDRAHIRGEVLASNMTPEPLDITLELLTHAGELKDGAILWQGQERTAGLTVEDAAKLQGEDKSLIGRVSKKLGANEKASISFTWAMFYGNQGWDMPKGDLDQLMNERIKQYPKAK